MAGAPEMRRSFSSGSGEASLAELSYAVHRFALDGSGRPSDIDAPGGEGTLPVTDSGGRFGARGCSSTLYEGFSLDSIHHQTEHLDEERGVPSQTIQYESVGIRSLASPTRTDENAPIEFAKRGDSLPIQDSVDQSRNSGHDANAHHDFFVFGGHAGSNSFATNATQTNTSKDAKHVFGSIDNDLPDSESCEISTTVETPDTITSSFGTEDGIVTVSSIKVPCNIEVVPASELVECQPFDEKSFTFDDQNVPYRNKGGVKGMGMNRGAFMPNKSSANQASFESVSRSGHCSKKVSPEEKLNLKEASSSLQTTESGHTEAEFTSAANTEHSGQSDFIFSASTFHESMLHPQRRHNKKKSGGMGNHASSIQSLPSSAIGLACSEVSGSQQRVDLAAKWTEYSKIEPNRVAISRGARCSTSENFGDHDNCETWRLRGNQAYAEGLLTKAEECYTHGIDSFSPNEVSRKALMLCYSNRAATRMSLGKMRDALSDCQEAIDIDSSFLKAHARAANCLLALGDVEEAQKAFEMCLKSNHLSSLDHKIVEEASDGLQKAKKISGLISHSEEYLIKKAFDKIPSALQMISDALSISIYSDKLMEMKAEALLLVCIYVAAI